MSTAHAGGNGEQSISRDVYRLGSRLGWFRLMSWYHSGIGFFLNSTLTMASVYLSVWLVFVFALADSLTVRNGSDGTTRVRSADVQRSSCAAITSKLARWSSANLRPQVESGPNGNIWLAVLLCRQYRHRSTKVRHAQLC